MKTVNIKILDCIVFILTFTFSFIGISVASSVLSFREYITDYQQFVFIFFLLLFLVTLNYSQKLQFTNTDMLFVMLLCVILLSLVMNEESFAPMIYISLTVVLFKKTGYIKSHGLLLVSAAAISLIPYFKIITTSNSLGINFCLLGVAFLNELYKKAKYGYVIFAGMIIGGGIIITYSRTSILVFFIIYIYYVYQIINKKAPHYRGVMDFCITAAALLFLFLNLDSVSEFFSAKWNGADISSGRFRIWKGTVTDGLTLFGNGKDYFLLNFNKGDSHNIFIEVLGKYGVPALFLFVCFSFSLFKKALIKKDREAVIFLLAYYMLGMFENILIFNTRMIAPTIVFYFYFSRITQNDITNESEISGISGRESEK